MSPNPKRPLFSRGYLLLEVFWISLAIAMTGYIALCRLLQPFADNHVFTGAESNVATVMLVLLVLAFFGDLFVIPTAIGGLFGRIGMVVGAGCGFVLSVAVAIHSLYFGHF